MVDVSSLDDCFVAIRRGQECVAPDSPLAIDIRELRQLLLGAKDDDPKPAPHRMAKVVLENFRIHALERSNDESASLKEAVTVPSVLLRLENLTRLGGGPLPALILRNCVIEGILDLSGSHYSGLSLYGCKLRGLLCDGAQVDNDCVLENLGPLETPVDGSNPNGGLCQIRMVSMNIDGSVSVRNCQLRSPDWVAANSHDGADQRSLDCLDRPTVSGAFPNIFALTLASSHIAGRVWITHKTTIRGGLSLYQATIDGSLSIGATVVSAHHARRLGRANLSKSDRVVRLESIYALSAREVRIGGSFRWAPASSALEKTGKAICQLSGKVDLSQCDVAGDISFERCKFTSGKKLVEGGIDLRRAVVGGQLNISDGCLITPRRGLPHGLSAQTEIPPALDCWKASFALGVVLHGGGVHTKQSMPCFRGPIYLNGSKVGRELFIEARIEEPFSAPRYAHLKEEPYRYRVALNACDAEIGGRVMVNVTRADGRVSFERASIGGSLEIDCLAFKHARAVIFKSESHEHKARRARILAARKEAFKLRNSDWPRFSPRPPFTPADKDWVDWGREPIFDNDERSILDLEDVTVKGGVNLKRGAVQIADECLAPPNGFIVDMRGMSCVTWDDADATCWEGLQEPKTNKGTLRKGSKVRWRLRFDSLSFERLDSSHQKRPLSAKIVPRRPRTTRWFLTALDHLVRWAWLPDWASSRSQAWWMSFQGARRTGFTLRSSEVLDFRLNAIESFHSNRNIPPLPVESKDAGWFRKSLNWIKACRASRLHGKTRWTRQSSWRRREVYPPFSPQPYDTFARSYLAQGNIEAGLAMLSRRMDRAWRRRRRVLSINCYEWSMRALPPFYGLGLGFLLSNYFGWHFGLLSPDVLHTLARSAFFFAFPFALRWIPLAFTWVWISAFRIFFGYGLKPKNAILTAFFFVGVVAFTSPTLMSAREKKNCSELGLLPSSTFAPEAVKNNMIYAAEKLLPVNLGGAKRIAPRVSPANTTTDAIVKDMPVPHHSRLSDADRRQCADWAQSRFRVVDGVFSAFGWIVLSLTLLTLSGMLRRDIERK